MYIYIVYIFLYALYICILYIHYILMSLRNFLQYIYIYIYILHNLRLVSNFKGYSYIFLRDIDDDQDVLYKFLQFLSLLSNGSQFLCNITIYVHYS